MAVWVDELTEEEYLTCPRKFIPAVAWQWYEIRAYRSLCGVGVPYDQVSGREYEATLEFALCEQRWSARAVENRKRTGAPGGVDDEELERLVRQGVKRRNEEHNVGH